MVGACRNAKQWKCGTSDQEPWPHCGGHRATFGCGELAGRSVHHILNEQVCTLKWIPTGARLHSTEALHSAKTLLRVLQALQGSLACVGNKALQEWLGLRVLPEWLGLQVLQ